MAYFSQERKKEMQPKIKALLKEYGFKGSLSVRNYSTVVLTIKEGKEDIIGFYNMRTELYNEDKPEDMKARKLSGELELTRPPEQYPFEGKFSYNVKEFLIKAFDILNDGNHNNSDVMTDYYDIGWYVNLHIGTWKKPYKYAV